MATARPPEAPVSPSPALAPPTPLHLAEIIEQVDAEAHRWWSDLSVTIGQAKVITGLKDSQIRYYEELEALRPRKTSAQSGASRLFSMAELRRLRVLALLNEAGLRAAEAAELVRAHSGAIDVGARRPIAAIIREERGVVADGFVITRLMSQVIAAAEAELGGEDPANPSVRVRGAILPLRRLFASDQLDEAEVQAVGQELLRAPADVLVALTQGSDPARLKQMPRALQGAGDDDQTVLFYSHEVHDLGLEESFCFSVYTPAVAPQRTVLLLLACDAHAPPPCVLRPERMDQTRVELLDRLLELCEAIAPEFRSATLMKSYRYRSDGFPLTLTAETGAALLATIRRVLLPTDQLARIALLVPDTLDQPGSLSILAHAGYAEELVSRVRLDLRGEYGQGLSGRAFRLREPFLSLRADEDTRIEYALEEGCHQALAVPLAFSWSLSPFGVLYVSSSCAEDGLDSKRAYAALILAGILSELLGRWWLTRLRRELDQTLHRQLRRVVGWIDSLDERGPSFRAGLTEITDLWQEIAAQVDEPAFTTRSLTLAVIDIDHFRHTVQMHSSELMPLHAQHHVNEAVSRVAPELRLHWFKNDHALLCIRDYDRPKAANLLARIIDLVELTPLKLPSRPTLRTITVSAAFRTLAYKALHDLGRDRAELEAQVDAIVRQLTAQAGREGTRKLIDLDEQGQRGARNGMLAEIT